MFLERRDRRRKLPFWRRLARKHVSLLMVAIVGGGTICGYLYYSGYREALEAADASTMNIGRMFESRLEATLRRADALLDLLAARIPRTALEGAPSSSRAAEIDGDLDVLRFNFDEVSALQVFNAAGEMIYSSNRAGTPPANMADRTDFAALRDNPAGGNVYSVTMTGRPAGQPSVAVARALTDGSGRFAGLALAVVDLGYFEELFHSLAVGPDALMAIRRSTDHTLLAHWPNGGAKVNRPLAADNPIRLAIEAGQRATNLRYFTTLDGVRRIVAVRMLAHHPFYVVIGLSTDQVFSGWYQRAVAVGAGGLLLLALSGYLLNLLGRAEKTAARAALQMAAERNFAEALLDNTPSLVVVLDRDGRILRFNRASRQATGFDEADVKGRLFAETTLLPELAAPPGRTLARLLSSSPSVCHESLLTTRTGENRMVAWQSTVIRNEAGEVEYVIGAGQDITERRRVEAELRLAASVYHNTMEGILVTDDKGKIISVNPAFTGITGYTAEEAIGRTPRILKSDHHDSAFYAKMWSDLLQFGWWQGEIYNRRKNGEVYVEWLTITRIPDAEDEPTRYVAVFTDTTEKHLNEERIRHLAYHDALTGLPNRQLLEDRIDHAIAKAGRDHAGLALMFLDLDRFKVINDTLGHNLGDLLLKEVARRIAACLRATDTVARLGGDEFVVLLEDSPNSAAIGHVAEKIIESVGESFDLDGTEVHVSTSIGVAMFPQDGADSIALMRNADTAMYQAKARGRNRFSFFDTSMNSKALARLELENALRRALERHEFELHYQPKLCLRTRHPCGFEALIRWRNPERGLVPPGDFIPLAEETGLIGAMGDWVIDEACRQIAEWRRAGLGVLPVAVNVSPVQLNRGDLSSRIIHSCERWEIPPEDLEVEVTEGNVMRDPDAAIAALSRLRRIGVSVAVDDFGTGYSSLAYLKRLPIDVIKVDRSFVMEADSDPEDAEIVRTIVMLGKTLNKRVVAEGVENQAQLDLLTDLGCSVGQGYLFGRPMPAADLPAWLIERSVAPCQTCGSRREQCLV